jgi:hypothetical protein
MAFFNTYFFYSCFILILTLLVLSILIFTLLLIFIYMRYSTWIYNWLKHSAEQFCQVVNTQIYSYSYEAQRTLQLHSNQPVTELVIHRKPIPSLVNTALNIITSGKWNRERKKNNQLNTLYHLVLECGLADGTKVYCQKNERIEINTCYIPSLQTEFCHVPLPVKAPPPFTLNDMLKKANVRMGDSKYFLFSPMDNNCQVYIKNILQAADLYTDTVEQFVFQNVDDVVATFSPFANKMLEVVKWCVHLKNTLF